MENIEVIVPIKDFDGYFISENGKVYCNLNKGSRKRDNNIDKELHEIMPRLTKNGYDRVYLRQTSTNTRKDLYIHRLVAEYFIPNPEKKKYVDHINCIRTDNRKENLRWSTAKENTSHTEEIGHVIRDKKGRYVSNFDYKEFL